MARKNHPSDKHKPDAPDKAKGNGTSAPRQKISASKPATANGFPSRPDPAFPIVGIGASAGGLGAFEAFFSGMPAEADPGMAFVLVQHLAPDHKSILTDLVKRYTRMQVFEVTDGMRVKPNCAYIIPPNRDMALMNGLLQLLEPSSPRGMRQGRPFYPETFHPNRTGRQGQGSVGK
jgi:two-component system, chemotaxis family, CheB/CheR fusion protein